MTTSVGSRSSLAYIPEVTYGVTPATPSLIAIPFVTFNVNKTTDRHEDPSIQGDRQQRHNLTGNTHVTGDIDFSFAPTDFDPLIESVMNSTWASNILKVGNTQKSFTLENALNDVGIFRTFTGSVVDKMSFTIPPSGIVTMKASMVCKDMTVASATIDAGGGYAPATAGVPFQSNTAVLKEGGTTIAYVPSLTMTLDNGISQNFAIGSSTVRSITSNWFKVTGTLTSTMENSSLLGKFLNSTETQLEFTVTSGVKTFKVEVNTAVYTATSVSVSGQGTVTATMTFSGLYDASDASMVVITRSA